MNSLFVEFGLPSVALMQAVDEVAQQHAQSASVQIIKIFLLGFLVFFLLASYALLEYERYIG